MKTKNWAIAISASLVLLFLLGWWLRYRQVPAATAKVRMGYLPMISSLTFFVALEKGYFEEAGLEIEGIPIKTSDNLAKTIANGDIEIGVELSVVPLLKGYEEQRKLNGANIESTFLIFSHSLINSENGFDSVVVNKDSPIKDWRDLSGKTIGAFPGTTAEKTILDVFKRDFGDLPPPKVITKDATLHIASLLNDEIDALHTYEPFLTQGKVQHNFRVVRTSLYAAQMPKDANGKLKNSPIGVAAVNRNWWRDHPEVASKAIKALDRAAEYIEKYPDDARRIAAKFTQMDATLASVMNIMPMTKSSMISAELLSDYIKILADISELNEPADVTKILIQQHK